MKIMLILPAADHLRARQNGRVTRRNMLRFSILPLTTVAGLTPSEHLVTICDENVSVIDFDAEVDVVGISFMTALAPRAYEIAETFKARGVATVAGGFHPTFMPDEAAEHFDSVVIGDAEELWPRALADIQAGTANKLYRHETLPSLEKCALPRRDLLADTAKHYATTNAIQVGRGCSHGCTYCSISAFHQQTYRTKPIRAVIDELQRVSRDFIFVDDNIIADRSYAKQLFQSMIRLKKRWISQCSIEIADDPELLELAYKAGCRGLFIGVETVNSGNLSAVNKSFNNSDRYKHKISRIRQQGIGVIAGIIVGMDNDTVEVFEETAHFLAEAHVDAIQVNIMTPLPGTPLFDKFQQQRRVTDYDWGKYDFRHVVMRPTRMTEQQLQDGADWLYSEFYRFDRIVKRSLNTLFTCGLVPAYLTFKLNMTYRYDNLREDIMGKNPARETILQESIYHIAGELLTDLRRKWHATFATL